jgi:4-hydroxy-3-methylbut-2-en-1-yl diphosphate reductase
VSKRVLVAAPRSFCAGVVRAIDIVEKLLDQHGPPVYVRHEIVHNVHVVRDLEARGAVFVESEDEVPEGELIVLSAHGVAPKVYEKCAERGLKVVDAVCPLVSKVHAEARRYAGRGLKIALVGHAGHVEVEGTMGEAPESILLVETPEDARNLEVEDGEEVAYITQTTLSLDDTADVVDTLRERFPNLVGPPSADICYATQNRQDAVKRICEEATLVLVVGSRASSNANRLVEVARDRGADAYLIDDETDLDPA